MERPDSTFEAELAQGTEATLAMGADVLLPFRAGLPPTAIDALLREHDPELTAHERMAQIVSTIESDIIPRLLRSYPQPAAGSAPCTPAPARVDDVAGFTALVLAPTDDGWCASIQSQLARGVCVEDLYMHLIGPTATELGRLWDEDHIAFTDVTVGLGRLQRMLRSLSPAFDHARQTPADGRRVLLVNAPGNQHSLGISLVAEFFRRAGWDVGCEIDASAADAVAAVRGQWFDVVGISVADEGQLAWLAGGVAALRAASRNRAIGVMVGGAAFARPGVAASPGGADCVVTDAREAPVLAERLLGNRTDRLAPVG